MAPLALSAHIGEVQVYEPAASTGNVVEQGLSFLKNRTSLLGGGQYAAYHVNVTKDGNEYSVTKRFSDFTALHNSLKGRYGANMPCELPAKTALRKVDVSELEDRKNGLNAYLRSICSQLVFISDAEVSRFFEAAMEVTLSAHIVHVEIRGTPASSPVLENGVERVLKEVETGVDEMKNRCSLLGGGQHAVYHVQVTRDGTQQTILKRFSQFVALHDFLKGRYGARMTCELPAKTALRQFDVFALEQRKDGLNAYLRDLCIFPDIIANADVLKFFDSRERGASIDMGDSFASIDLPRGRSPSGPSGARAEELTLSDLRLSTNSLERPERGESFIEERALSDRPPLNSCQLIEGSTVVEERPLADQPPRPNVFQRRDDEDDSDLWD